MSINNFSFKFQQTFVLVKTYWRRPEDIFSVPFILSSKTSSRYICKKSSKKSWRRLVNVLKAFWKRFWKTYYKHVLKASWRCLWRQKIVTMRTSSRRLEKQEMLAAIYLCSMLLKALFLLPHLVSHWLKIF